MKKEHPEVSIILPCRNEELALPFCLKQIKKVIKKEKLNAEIIVSDSSADNSPKIAKKFKTILIKHDKEGYGNAYLEAFKIAKGKYIFMADCDGTYDFNEIPKFIKELKRRNDLILGNRFAGKMEKDSMPMSNRYLGNPILSGILRVFFHTKIKDSHTGMRAIKKQSLNLLNLKTIGMEFASEMIIKSIKKNLKIKEIPIDYHKRKGNSKLKPYRDAWKHIRFMLLYSPLFLFFIPGLILFFLGLISLIIIGYQLIIFSVFAKSYAINHLGETESKLMRKLYQIITLERVSIIGIITTIVGAVIYLIIFLKWIESGFPALNEIKNSILALTLITLGIQTIFSAFMLSILSIKEK